MKSENGRTKGLLIWAIFTAIMIIVVCAAVLVFVFKVKFSGNNDNKSAKTNEVVASTSPSPSASAKPKPKVKFNDVEIVPTMEDELESDAVWVPTFQLVWNDMMDEVVKDDVRFIDDDEPDYLDNLNAQLFTEDDISDDFIYKNFGKTSNELRDEILEGIKDKFDETSDVIDPDEDWTVSDNKDEDYYTFYAMLKRAFNFEKPFDTDDGSFANGKYSNVDYFGIDKDSDEELYDQVTVLYYDSHLKFAFLVDTKEGDQLVFSKGIEGDTFAEIYDNIAILSNEYDGRREFKKYDELKIPNLNINVKKEYDELCNKPFKTYKDKIGIITDAIQTVKLELDNEGGKIKSEAESKIVVISSPQTEAIQFSLNLNDEFVMFVKEEDKDKPYFALKVTDISKFQDNVKTNDKGE